MRKHIVFGSVPTEANGGEGYFPKDIRRLYNIPANLQGEGQTIGILEFSNGYSLRDAQQFWALHGIPVPNVKFVSVDGTRNDGGVSPDDEEASLDLQWAGAIAPKAQIVVYEANAGSTYADFSAAMTRTLQFILDDTTHQPSVLSVSYGDAEQSFGTQAVETWANLIAQLDAKGVTVCVSSGDQGAYGMHDPNGPHVPHADAPASVPHAVSVGGTSLQPDGTETAWSYRGPANGGATGGGFSGIFARPAYQGTVRGGATRGFPDVSLNADPATGYQIIFQGRPAVVGGTSVSAPVFAAIVALANEQRAASSLPPVSNLNATLYQHGHDAAFKDVTAGDNAYNGVQGYSAVPGWDACTGWGSVNAAAFIQLLSGTSVPSPTPTPTPTPTPNRGGTGPGPTNRLPVIHVKAILKAVEPDVQQHGAYHHHLLLARVEVLSMSSGHPSSVGKELFCAIRYGDKLGLPGPIPDLAVGQPIELQGEYIDKNHAYPSIGNPGDPVLHYTHHPVGYVVYHGHRYE